MGGSLRRAHAGSRHRSGSWRYPDRKRFLECVSEGDTPRMAWNAGGGAAVEAILAGRASGLKRLGGEEVVSLPPSPPLRGRGVGGRGRTPKPPHPQPLFPAKP